MPLPGSLLPLQVSRCQPSTPLVECLQMRPLPRTRGFSVVLFLVATCGLVVAEWSRGQVDAPPFFQPSLPQPISPRQEPGTVDLARLQAAQILSVERIWDQAPHNAFTDLIRFQERWYCVFREGSAHASPDGKIRVLTSSDGAAWISAAQLEMPGADLRDPKLSITVDTRLMLSAAAAYGAESTVHHQTLAWYSIDGRAWGEPFKIGDPNMWLWSVTWHRGNAYSVGYSTTDERFLRFYMGPSGLRFQPVGHRIYEGGQVSEATLLFDEYDDSALCLVRRDGAQASALLGFSRQPYKYWEWKDLGVRVGGPRMIRLPDKRIVVGARLYDPQPRTALCWLDPETASLREFLELPSGGDTGYPGLAYQDGLLWVSYYSSHEGRAAIYLARVRLPVPQPRQERPTGNR